MQRKRPRARNAMEFSDIQITVEPLVIPSPAFESGAGAMIDFYGVVRAKEGEGNISGLDYEVFEEMALRQLAKIVDETVRKRGLRSVILHHRVGFVPVAEPSLFLRVSAAHRGEAFLASQEIIERLKREVPIWKHPQHKLGAPEAPGALEAAP
ncbi:MAG TPA: molybdenum cofactor biosynthesis protein MoaE [Chthoniobacterales bacterium]